MKKLIFTSIIVLLFSCCVSMYGQISTQEKPVSFRTNIPAVEKSDKTVKWFVSLDMNKIEKEDLEEETNGLPPRFGYRHEVNYNLENSGEWTDLPDGSKIWQLTIPCAGNAAASQVCQYHIRYSTV